VHHGRPRDRGRPSGLNLQRPRRHGKDASTHGGTSSPLGRVALSLQPEASPTASRGRSSLQRPARRLPRHDEHRHPGHRLLRRDEHPRPAHRPREPLERLASPPSPERQRPRREPPLRREHRRRHLAPHPVQARPLPRRGEHPHLLLPHPHRGSRQPPAHRLQHPHRRAADGLRQEHRRSQHKGRRRRRDSLTWNFLIHA
jgi:hypothetical protein